MKTATPVAPRHEAAAVGEMARRGAGLVLVALAFATVLFAGAWVLGGDDAVSDNWVGVTVVVALMVGVFGSFATLVTAVFAGLRHEHWSRLWLPLTTFPAVVIVVALLEALVFE